MKGGLGLVSCDLVCQIGDLLNSRAEEPRHISIFARLPSLTTCSHTERGNVTAILHEIFMN
jgi:hypothetical protein